MSNLEYQKRALKIKAQKSTRVAGHATDDKVGGGVFLSERVAGAS